MIPGNKQSFIADNEKNLKLIGDFMMRHDETIAVAESVTSGYLQVLLSSSAEASRFYHGGMTTYTLNQKTRQLGIDPLKALANNCVSEEVAAQMATEITHQFSSDREFPSPAMLLLFLSRASPRCLLSIPSPIKEKQYQRMYW